MSSFYESTDEIAILHERISELARIRQGFAAHLGSSLYEVTKDDENLRWGRESLYDGIALCDRERERLLERIAELQRHDSSMIEEPEDASINADESPSATLPDEDEEQVLPSPFDDALENVSLEPEPEPEPEPLSNDTFLSHSEDDSGFVLDAPAELLTTDEEESLAQQDELETIPDNPLGFEFESLFDMETEPKPTLDPKVDVVPDEDPFDDIVTARMPEQMSSPETVVDDPRPAIHMPGSIFHEARSPHSPQKVCLTCGAAILDGNVFCMKCGSPVAQEEREEPPSQIDATPSEVKSMTRDVFDAPRESEPSKPVFERPVEAPAARTCPKCGAVARPNDKFCMECGSRLSDTSEKPQQTAAPKPALCPECGSRIDPSFKFCMTCGHKL